MPQRKDEGCKINFTMLQTIGACSPSGFLCCSFKYNLSVLFENANMKSMIGYDNGKALAWMDYIHSQDQVAVWNYFSQLPEGGCGQINHRIILRNGLIRFLSAKVKKLKLEDEGVVIICHYEDITNIVEHEATFQKEIKILQDYISNVPCGLFQAIVDDNLTITYGNPFFYQVYGYNKEDISDYGIKNFKIIVDSSDFPQIKNKIVGYIEEKKYYFELEFQARKKSGELIWVLVRCNYNLNNNTIVGAVFDITDRKLAEEQLRISEEENRIAVLQSDKMTCKYYIKEKRIYFTEHAVRELGITQICENVPNENVYKSFIEKESVGQYLTFIKEMEQGKANGSCLLRIKSKQGKRWFKVSYTLVYDNVNNPSRAIVTYWDFTEQHEKEIAYKRWQQVYKVQRKDSISYYEYNLSDDVVESMDGLMYTVPDDYNKTFSALINFVADHYVVTEDRNRYKSTLSREQLLLLQSQNINEVKCEHRRIDNNGNIFWAMAQIEMIVDPYASVVKAFVLIKDIDVEKKRALKLKQLSETDPLTGLYNRGAIIRKIDNIINNGIGTEEHAFIIVDIDYFKGLNDNFGHQFGDRVIVETAKSLKESLRSDDICGRLGGDEFAIFIQNVHGENSLMKKLDTLRCKLEKKYQNDCSVTGSLGLARYPVDGTTFHELYEKADKALYRAKNHGRNRFVIYDDLVD